LGKLARAITLLGDALFASRPGRLIFWEFSWFFSALQTNSATSVLNEATPISFHILSTLLFTII
jgi:hypothetical protein